jgi:hypothetical protein
MLRDERAAFAADILRCACLGMSVALFDIAKLSNSALSDFL